MVYVLNIDGNPLMPTERLGRVRRLLKIHKAVIVNYHPFTIKLTYKCSDRTQEVSLGVDAGSKHVGLSATTKKKVLFEAQLELRSDIVKKLATRREFRRTRRNRKTRYRKSRFLNRTKFKKKGWLAPSVKHKVWAHLWNINRIKRILPISRITIEVAQFDTQLLKAKELGLPAPQGTDYQRGEQLGFWNVREYVLFRDGHKCQCCKGKSGDTVLNVHHIESRKTGGNAPNNLVTLCATCHKKYHKGEIMLPASIKRGSSYKDATFMGIIRKEVYRMSRVVNNTITCPVGITYGYITKNTRIRYGLPKEHTMDARCISGNPMAKSNGTTYIIKPLRHHNRQLHKASILAGGIRKNNQAPKEVFGFRLMDTVLYNGQACYVNGRRTSGYFSLVDINGKVLTNSVSYRELTRINHNNYIIGGAIPLTH
jgi:N6-L-threonylcarbamoyladenine synthase